MTVLSVLSGGPTSPPRHATILECLINASRSRSGLSFLDSAEKEEVLPYRDLYVRARRAAGNLLALGVRPRDRVALILPTGVDFMDAFFGTLLAGAVPVPLYPPVRLGRLEEYHARTARMLQTCGARLVLTDARLARVLGTSMAMAGPELGMKTSAELSQRRGADAMVKVAPDAIALVQFSSGTVADPRPVALTHTNVMANVEAIDSLFIQEDGVVSHAGVSWLPLYHDMGLIGCLLTAIYHPGPLTLIPPEVFLAKPAIWLRAISRKRATLTVAPSFAFGLCLKRIRDEDLTGVDLSSWKLALNGAEPISAAVLRRFCARMAPYGFSPRALTPVYGLSEASLAVTFFAPEQPFRARSFNAAALAVKGEAAVVAPEEVVADSPGQRELVSLGSPIPGVDLKVCGEDDEPLATGKVGRVLVRGPSVMSGYYGHPEASAQALRKGWLDTGDLGFIHEGELYLASRSKDLVIIRGANHSPQQFEDALDGLLGVRAGCAVAVGFHPPGGDGEELALLVERDADAMGIRDSTLEETIRTRVTERTGVRPHTVLLLAPGTLPRTSSGKLRRAEALLQFLAGALAPPAEVTFFGMAKEMARSMAAYARSRL